MNMNVFNSLSSSRSYINSDVKSIRRIFVIEIDFN